MSALRIRPASPDDIDALSALETAVFATDRISRRSFRSLIARPTAATLVAEDEGGLAGYAMILFRAGTGMARLYSIAVAPERGGAGIGRALLEAAEDAARSHDRIVLRLEVREDNAAAIALYRRSGYRPIGRIAGYYEDGMAALRFEKLMRGGQAQPLPAATPFYEQTTDFTCGSACLVMALGRFVSRDFLDPIWEIRLWREATTIFMLAGPGGCEPYGLAVVAREHGLTPVVYCSQSDLLFLDTVRNPEKRVVMELAQMDFRKRAKDLAIEQHISAFTLADILEAIRAGKVVAVLVSGYLMFGKKVPHWILAHGDDGRHVIVHDPWVEDAFGETVADAANLPVPYAVFDRISRFGRNALRAAVVLEGTRPDV